MIICSKQEGNGTFREFLLDDAAAEDEIRVKTHLAHRVSGSVIAEAEWMDAGVITRSPHGLRASVARAVRGKRQAFVVLDRVFSNEVAALQAIALNFETRTRAHH
jgi:hypothetical protein